MNISSSLSLCPITSHNAAEILPLMQACYPPVYQHLWEDQGDWYLQRTYGINSVLEDLAKPDAPYWIVQWQTAPAGILRLQLHERTPDFPGQQALKLQRIYLHPSTHGQGIGRQLMEFAFAQAIELGKGMVWLEAMDTQQTAQAFYHKMGFRTTGTLRLPFVRMHSHYRGMIRMTKDL